MLKKFISHFIFLLFIYSSFLFSHEKMVVGHYRDWGIYSPNYHINDIDATKLTHLVYESALLKKDGSVVSGDLYADQQYFYPGFDPKNDRSGGGFGQLQQLKKTYPYLKVLISVGGWNRSQNYSEVLLDEKTRAQFVQSALEFVQRHGFDGLELNWSYQAVTLSDGRWSQEEQKSYLQLIKKFRDAIDKLNVDRQQPILLTISLEQNINYLQGLALDDIYKLVDIINLNRNYIHSLPGGINRHISALYNHPSDAHLSIDSAVQFIKKETGVVDKLLISIPSFSIAWQGINTSGSGNVLYQKTGSPSWGSWDSYGVASGLYARTHLLKFQENRAYKMYWDEYSKASYLYSKGDLFGHFISFEGERAIAEKVNYVEAMGLAGISISQLHNDSKGENSIIAMVFSTFNPWKSIQLSIIETYADYKLKIQLLITLLLSSLLFLVIIYYRNRVISLEQQQDKRDFNRLQAQLQSISVPLQSCLQLNHQAQKLAMYNTVEDSALSVSFKLLQKVDLLAQQLLQETRLGKNQRLVKRESFLVNLLIDDVLQIIKVNQGKNTIKVITNIANSTMFSTDRNYLQQVLLSLLSVALLRKKKADIIELHLDFSGGDFEIKIVEPMPDKNYRQWQDLICSRKIIQKLQGSMVIKDYDNQIITGIKLVNFMPVLITNNRTEQDLSTIKNKPLVESDYLRLIGDFANQVAVQNSVDQIVEHAYQLLNSTFSELTVSVLQGNKTLYKPEIESTTKRKEYIEVAQLLDYSFVIYDVSQRNSDQVLFIKTLISQINMVREQLCQMVKTPRLLIELYEIASQKEKIEYIQAAKGYSGLYLKGVKEPTYVTLRLRGIKQYFNDNVLLHIHRSYLVNPNKVIAVKQISRMSYVIQLETLQLPIGRSYLAFLRSNYPHWFQ